MTAAAGAGDVTATGRLVVDASGVRAGVGSAQSSLTSLYDVVRNNWWGLQAIGASFGAMGAAASAGLHTAVSAAADFQQGMATIARTTQLQGESAAHAVGAVQGLGDELKKISETRPIQVNTLQDIAAQAGQLGIARKDVASFTSTIADLISTTNLTEQSATSLAKTSNIFNLGSTNFKRLGSAIYEAGVNTAATETDIVNMTNRLGPFAHQAGFTAAQTVGLSAAVLSLGPRAEAGATSLQRFFGQMAAAANNPAAGEVEILAKRLGTTTEGFYHMLNAANGNKKALTDIASQAHITETQLLGIVNSSLKGSQTLNAFAQIAGTSADDFKRLIETDPSKALTSFIEGLGHVSTNSVSAHAALAQLGITEQREITTLEALASGTENGRKSSVNLSTALRDATNAYKDGNVVRRAAQAQNATLNAQWQETRNIFHNVAIDLGNQLVPSMGVLNGVVADVGHGLEYLPGPLQAVIAGFVAVGGVTGSAISSLLLVGSRALLARAAYTQLKDGIGGVIAVQRTKMGADAAEQASTARTAFLAGLNHKALQAEIVAKEREATLIRTTASLRSAEVDLLELQNTLLEQQAALQNVLNGESEADVTIAEARIAETEALIEAKKLEIATSQQEVVAQAAANEEISLGSVIATGFGAAIRAALGPIGLVIGALALVTGGTALFGSTEQNTTQSTEELTAASQTYVQALKDQMNGQKDAVKTAIALDIINSGLVEQARHFGISVAQMIGYIRGEGSAIAAVNGQISGTNRAVGDFFGNFGKATDLIGRSTNLIGGLDTFQQRFAHAEQIMRDTSKVSKALGIDFNSQDAAQKQLANDTGGLNDKMGSLNNTLKVTADQAAQAGASIAQDSLNVESARSALTQAEQKYNDALAATKDRVEAVRKAELDLKAAQEERKLDVIAVSQAETDLKNARKNAQEQLRRDILSEQDAQYSYQQALDQVAQVKQKIKDLAGAKEALAEKEAYDALTGSILALTNAQIKRNDASAQLAYLRSEGASARDIADAERTLQQSQQDVSDASNKVKDSQANLNKVRADSSPKAMAQAERELTAAERAAKEALDRLHDSQQKVAQDRKDIRNDIAYMNAQKNLTSAEQQLADASQKINDAEKTLRDTKSGVTARNNLRDASNGLKTAVLNLASAQVTLKEDQDTANGKLVTGYDHLRNMRNAVNDLQGSVNRNLRPAIRSLGDDFRAARINGDSLHGAMTGGYGQGGGILGGIHELQKHRRVNGPDFNLRAALRASKVLMNFDTWFDNYVKNWSPNKKAPPPPDMPTNGIITGGGAKGATVTGRHFMEVGEESSEVIMPIQDLWKSLKPLETLAAQSVLTNQLISQQLLQIMAQKTDDSGPTQNHQHNDIKIDVTTPVDAMALGSDIAWSIRGVI